VAKSLIMSIAYVGRATGRYLSAITTGLPVTAATANLLRWTRLVDRSANPHVVRETFQEMLTTDPDWYANLALGIATHRRVGLSSVKVPVTMLAGTHDMLTSAVAMRTAAERLHDVVFIEIDATHFIPFGQPELVLAELKNVLDRVDEA
jgi:pimeloyl-ACP methyl ester carboxylesterase